MDTIKKIAVVFPGQASQYVGMGKELLYRFPEQRDLLETGERITGLSLVKLCLEGPLEELTRTLVCQPAVFAVSLLCWQVLNRQCQCTPMAVAGHSLGEYTACAVAGAFSLEEGFHLVRKRAEIMDAISNQVDGGMLAIIGKMPEDVAGLLQDFPRVQVANINAPNQVVVVGYRTDLVALNTELSRKRVRGIMLKVSGPFHSEIMQPGVPRLETELSNITLRDPRIPVYTNWSAAPARTADELRAALLRQMTSPVRWVDTIRNLAADGARLFVEVGPKKVLHGLIEQICPEIPVCNVEDAASLAAAITKIKEV